ncbi:MAG: hypothetical protein EZS28_031392 [Streblomastix strix]|uniref:Uncharacterized protein n=1 Tax=Streblomastix strix TaxID=222440 RepID=A0A5J4UT11_9EUKA|nr:MAG: hypothetical protein EZS28_031392 [Streblomastix strix]
MNFDQEVQPDVAQADEEITRKILLIAQKIPNCSVQEQTALLIKLVDIVSYVVRDGNLKLLIQNIKDSNIINIIRDSVNTEVKQLRIARNSLFSILFSFPFRHNVFIDANLTEFSPTKNLKAQIQDLERTENPNRSTRIISKLHKIKSNLLKAKTIYRASLKTLKKERFKSISGRLQNNLLQALMT